MAKSDELRQFLNQLPPAAGAKLWAAVESGKLPPEHLGLSLEDIRACLAPVADPLPSDPETPADPEVPVETAIADEPEAETEAPAATGADDGERQLTALRLFTQPFEDFLFDGVREKKDPGRIPRSSVEPVWDWLLEDLLPDTLPDMITRIDGHIASGNQDALEAAVSVMHEAIASALLGALGKSETDPELFDMFVDRLGGYDVVADAREISDVLQIAEYMSRMQKVLPRHIEAFHPHHVADVRDLYNEAFELEPDNAIYIALAVMGRLKEPWQILRLARKVAQRNDDTMISRTDFAVLGERLIGRLDEIANHFSRLRPGLNDLDMLLADIREFSELSKGITKEIELLRIGDWGQRLLKARNKISTAISDEFARYPKDLAAALPLQRIGGFGRSGPRRAEFTHSPNADKAARILSEVRFFADAERFAQAIGAQGAFDKTRPELETYMLTYEDAIIEGLRYCEGDEVQHGKDLLELAVKLTDLLSGSDAASTLNKRGRVALKAA